MDQQEQHQTRCKELRNIDHEIRLQRFKLVADENEERNILDRLRAEHAQFQAELIRLQSVRAGTSAGSAMPGVLGSVAGVIELTTSIDIANIEPKIQDVKTRIAISEEKISRFQQNHDRLNRSQAENAERMKELNCAMP